MSTEHFLQSVHWHLFWETHLGKCRVKRRDLGDSRSFHVRGFGVRPSEFILRLAMTMGTLSLGLSTSIHKMGIYKNSYLEL